jgi:hypothetical protein
MMNWQSDPFFQYPLSSAPSSEGPVALPILYYDNSTLMALFWVDHAVAQALVAPAGLQAVRFGGGKAMLAVAFYEYRDTAIGPYNEAGTAIAVLPPGARAPALPLLSLYNSLDKRHIGFHVLDLPVTTAAACAAGRDIWGYPKFITPIGFDLQGDRFEGRIADPVGQGDLLKLSGQAGIGISGPLLDLVLYSRVDGQLLRTLVNTRGGGKACLPGSMRLSVSDRSTHPMARHLLQCGLGDARPWMVMHTHRLQLRLNKGAAISG